MKFNKIFLLAGIAVAGVLASCSDDDYEKGAVAAGNQLQTVTFGPNNTYSAELDPEDPTSYTFTVYRDSAYIAQAASVPLKVITNDSDVFVAPSTAEFAAGSAEAQVTVTFDNAEIGLPYSFEVAIDDEYTHPYSAATYKTYTIDIQRVKWNNLGVGYWVDGFWYGYVFEVNIYQRDDNPLVFRFPNPYTDELVAEYVAETGDTDTETATYTPWITLTTTRNDYVVWDAIYINTYYAYYGAEIVGRYNTALADNCYVQRNAEGGIQYFAVNPYFYMDGIGGWSSYSCYLIFPGQDFPEGLLEEAKANATMRRN